MANWSKEVHSITKIIDKGGGYKQKQHSPDAGGPSGRSCLCTVIPIYQEKPGQDELFSIRNTVRKMGNFPVFLAAPKGFDLAAYVEFSEARPVFFPKRFFTDVFAYNRLMLSVRFYWKFKKFQYVLIAQTDALIIRDAAYLLALLQEYGYDYWGAPWKNVFERRKIDYTLYHKRLAKFPLPRRMLSPILPCEVGNGGLSLRNCSASMRLLSRHFLYKFLWGGPEDSFFSYFGQLDSPRFSLADREAAGLFSLEETLHERLHRQELPFGVHDWKHYFPDLMSYWEAAQSDGGLFTKPSGYQVGQTLYFAAHNFNASPYIISGISRTDPEFSWFVSTNVEFVFLMEHSPDCSGPVHLEFCVEQVYGGYQKANIYANGNFLGEKEIREGDRLAIDIPAGTGRAVRLRLEFPSAKQAKSRTVGEDVRRLSIAVTRMDSHYQAK